VQTPEGWFGGADLVQTGGFFESLVGGGVLASASVIKAGESAQPSEAEQVAEPPEPVAA
jgi:hypothetical protein